MTKGKHDMPTLRSDPRIQYQNKKGKLWEIINRKPFMSCFYPQDMYHMWYYFWNKWFKYETEIGVNQIVVCTLAYYSQNLYKNMLELEHSLFRRLQKGISCAPGSSIQ